MDPSLGMTDSLHTKFIRAYQLARESAKERPAVMLALTKVFPGASVTLQPIEGDGQTERFWKVSVLGPGGRALEAQGRTAMEAGERIVLEG